MAGRVDRTESRAVARDLLQATMLLMRTVAAEVRRSSSKPLAPAQLGTLMRLAASPCTLSDLARHQAVSLPTVSKSVEMLARRGWVERSVVKNDRRQTLVRLSAQGRLVLADVRQRAELHVSRKLAPITSDERAQLTAASALLIRILSGRVEEPLKQSAVLDQRSL